jgi:hypothetical protein
MLLEKVKEEVPQPIGGGEQVSSFLMLPKTDIEEAKYLQSS